MLLIEPSLFAISQTLTDLKPRNTDFTFKQLGRNLTFQLFFFTFLTVSLLAVFPF
ncbi:MAG: hypothetical protein ACXAC7_17300 [Candidatus Hodarchaeales archaeon]